MKKIILLLFILTSEFTTGTQAQTLQLWGMTYWGGLNDGGVIMHINENGIPNYTFPYSFGTPTGEFPRGSLIYDKDSIFYGMTLLDGADSEGVLFSFDPLTETYSDLVDFDSVNGSFPYGSLVQDTATGLLYGVTSAGGANNYGVIFSYNPSSSQYNKLYDFDSIHGMAPYGKLLLKNKGVLYGMTNLGGANDVGVIFRYNSSTKTYTDLYDLVDSTGAMPTGALIQVKNKIYGMTPLGGANNDGVIFSLDTLTHTYTDLLDFNYYNGANPYGSLLQANDSMLYGLTEDGTDSVSNGVLFQFNPDSNSYHILFAFDSIDGDNPSGSLIQAQNGLFYGTAQDGGFYTDGVIFSFNPDSLTYKDIYDLNNAVGGNPWGDLVEASVVTGIAPSPSKNSFIIYPNPSVEVATVVSPVIVNRVRIIDLYGQVIYTSTPDENEFTVDIKNARVYFITLISHNQTTTQKLIITK